ncbi:MAG: photosystem I reaction center subunit PsaK [Elainellaceae cyanobacterium]
MMNFVFLADVPPPTHPWDFSVAAVMIACNVLAFVLGRLTIAEPDVGPLAPMFLGMGLPALLAVTSFGHIIGAGVILGLTNIGAL